LACGGQFHERETVVDVDWAASAGATSCGCGTLAAALSRRLGFEIAWLDPGKEIGAVSRGKVAIFFRKRTQPFEPAVHWVFAEDIDATYQELQALGANIVQPLAEMPWGLRQFTVEDLDGNRFYFHHD
jgi:hypothetical protein